MSSNDTKNMLLAVEESNHSAGLATITLNIGNMTCAACVVHVGNALRELEGVVTANVNLATEQARVEYVPGLATVESMKANVEDAGYNLEGVAGDDDIDQENRLARTKDCLLYTSPSPRD